MKVIVTGGGTGGHVYPALSIADAFRSYDETIEILYIGTKKGIEAEIVPEYGYSFRGIEVKGFIRRLTFENIKRVYLAIQATRACKKIMRKFQPDVVIGTGGYVCGPVLKAAAKYGSFTAIHEQNAFPGLTNRLLAKNMDLIFLGFEKAKERFKTNTEMLFVGNPVRGSVFSSDKKAARKKLGIDEQAKMILSVGGSGGSESLNDAFAGAIPYFIEQNISFLHTTGKLHYDEFIAQIQNLKLKKGQEIKDYETDIPLYMAAADLVICSGGATTLAEVNAMGKAVIVIPKAYTAENHQEYNAHSIKENGAGEYILENDLNTETMLKEVSAFLQDDEHRKTMEKNSRKMYPENAAEEIVKGIMKRYKTH